MAQRLAQHHQEGRFASLKVVAAPRFLGYLRQAWSPQVAATISDELDKDLVKADLDELEKRLLPAHA